MISLHVPHARTAHAPSTFQQVKRREENLLAVRVSSTIVVDLVEEQLKEAGVEESGGFFVIKDHHICDISSTHQDSPPLQHRTHPLWCGLHPDTKKAVLEQRFSEPCFCCGKH
jgi:hypothetical protein